MTTDGERRLAAIFIADVVGYSRLVELDEAATLAAVKDLRRALLEPLMQEHHGRLVKLTGDGLIGEFASVFMDTTVLLDVVTDDPKCADWSMAQLESASLGRRLGLVPP
jgi:class 3 adenylate cyclase